MRSLYCFIFFILIFRCSYEPTDNRLVKHFLALTLFQSKQSNSKIYCRIEITSPPNNATISNNGISSSVFFFTVSGFMSAIDSSLETYNICLYQNKLDGTQWWRSGNSITKSQVGANGQWTTNAASCGDVSGIGALTNCTVTAIVQRDVCPPDTKKYSEAEIHAGGEYCTSVNYLYNR